MKSPVKKYQYIYEDPTSGMMVGHIQATTRKEAKEKIQDHYPQAKKIRVIVALQGNIFKIY